VKKLSNYLHLATLRLRRSWTLWLQMRQELKLEREEHRLNLLKELLVQQHQKVAELLIAREQRENPLQVVTLPPPLTQEQLTVPPRLAPATEELASQLEPTPPPRMQPLEPETEQPQQDPLAEISQRLGLPTPPTSSPS
jgi:hypothetical protein